MTTPEILAALRKSQPEMIERFKARVIGIFGSYARDEQHLNSDLDVLYEPVVNELFGIVELDNLDAYLRRLANVEKVDLVSRDYVNPVIDLEIQDDIRYV